MIIHIAIFLSVAVVVNCQTSQEIWESLLNIRAPSTAVQEQTVTKQPQPQPTTEKFKWARRSSAPVDECYCPDKKSLTTGACSISEKLQGCKDKTNEGYAWGMTRSTDKVFWGTLANPLCLMGVPSSGDENMCEGNGKDFRPPSAYIYSESSKHLNDMADQILDYPHFDRLNRTIGLRAAGSSNDVVIMAGPSLTFQSVLMFAFTTNGTFLDSVEFNGFSDVRKFTQDPKLEMYVGMNRIDDTGEIWMYSGSQLTPFKFVVVAQIDGSPAELTFYQDRLLVGTWPSGGSFGVDDDTKPAALLLSPVPASQLMLCVPDCNQDWITIWSIDDYEPDPVTALSYGVSVNVEWNGWVYWGTMQVPYGGVLVFEEIYGPAEDNVTQTMRTLGTHRATALFRAKNLIPVDDPTEGTTKKGPTIEMLYGESSLPVYSPHTDKWIMLPNRQRLSPRFGSSGFGNFFNLYTWSMAAVGDFLLIGTFDFSYGVFSQHRPQDVDLVKLMESHTQVFGPTGLLDARYKQAAHLGIINTAHAMLPTHSTFGPNFGADLFVIPCQGGKRPANNKSDTATAGTAVTLETPVTPVTPVIPMIPMTPVAPKDDIGPAEWITLNGLGNKLNIGIRNLMKDPSGKKNNVFIGTANAYNLDTDGGWEVYELQCPGDT